jgi:hypothetical protein
MELRDYQLELSEKAAITLKRLGIVYLTMEVRTGKTLTALEAAKLYGAKKVLFLTKKLAIKSILHDYSLLQPPFELVIINNESLHTIKDNDFDLLISDEHHRLGAFPKPNKMAKDIKARFGRLPMIFLSGTPAVESGSQWYHQFYVSRFSPFKEFTNFYKWADIFVNKKQVNYGFGMINDYSDCKTDKVLDIIEPYILRYTQEQAGFSTEIREHVIQCQPYGESLTERLKTAKVIEGKSEVVLADTAVKLMTKIHQIENGTIIFESGNSAILDTSKAHFIKERFKGEKIAIFYYYQKELELLRNVFGESLTTDLNEFNSSDKCIALQQSSGSEGISLKAAKYLVYYNFGFSGVKMIQGRDRMTTIDRLENDVYFVFAEGSINEKIYKTLQKKKRYSLKIFEKDYGTDFTIKN